jgi:hypothetical protein
MRWRITALLLTISPVFGQALIENSRVPEEWRDFSLQDDEPKLECSIKPIKPRLNYSFRFETGYVVQVPMSQYTGKGHWLATFFRVTPEHQQRNPVYFFSKAELPKAPATNVDIELSGGYVVGAGKYRVDMIVTDDSGRVCADKWTIKAKLDRKERGIEPGLAAGMAGEISLREWTHGSRGPGDEQGYRATILMNASPVLPGRVRLGGHDRVLLLSSLASLVERLPLHSVRLIVFSLDQQREIYRSENFEPADFGNVANALSSLELGTVDYSVLKNRSGHLDLVADLIAESSEGETSDAVVFLGPKPWHFDKVQRSALPERTLGSPPFFYVQFRPYMAAASWTDTVMNAVKRMGGQVFDVYRPADFAEAIGSITRALQQKKKADSGELAKLFR